jgi:glycosyltransferase involved in cell wall biosynthesis
MIGTLDPAAGGPAETASALLRYAPDNCTGEVVTLDDPAAAFLCEFPFPVHAFGPQRSVYGYSPKLMPWLKANRRRFDGVVVHGLWQYLGVSTARSMRGRIPYVVFTHGMLDPYFKHAFPWKHAKKWVYWLLAEYWVLRFASRVLFTCEFESNLAKRSFWLAIRRPSARRSSRFALRRGARDFCCFWAESIPKRAAICWWTRLESWRSEIQSWTW